MQILDSKLKYMATVSLYLDTRRMKKNGKYPVKLNVFHKGQMLLPTEFDASAETWNGTEYNRKAQNWKAKNVALRSLMNNVEKKIFELEESGSLRKMAGNELKDELKRVISGNNEKEGRLFLDVMREFMDTKSKRSTASCYEGTIQKLNKYDNSCTFDSMDRKWLTRFNMYLLDSGMKVNTCGIHLRNIRAVFNYAIDEGYTELYPFRKFIIKKEDTRKRSLTVMELRILRDYPCEDWQVKYRDMFMLMFYLIGINAVDLFNAKKTDLSNGRLEYKRSKTGRIYSIKLETEALDLINKYSGEEYLLFVMENYNNYKDFLHRMNDALRKIGSMECVGRYGKKVRNILFPDISSYWSRHTWATIAAELDIPKEIISEALGHRIGSETTSIYIKFDRKKVDEANRKVIDFVNSGKSRV